MNKLSSLIAKRNALNLINSMHKNAAASGIATRIAKEEFEVLKNLRKTMNKKELDEFMKLRKYAPEGGGGAKELREALLKQKGSMDALKYRGEMEREAKRKLQKENIKLTQKAKEQELNKRFKRSVITAGIAGGVGGAAYIGTKIFDDYEKDKAFKLLLQRFPELGKKDIFEAVTAYYDALWNLNPTLAKNPLVASTFIKSQIDLGMGIPPNLAVEMLKAKRPSNLEDMKRTFSSHMLSSFVGV